MGGGLSIHLSNNKKGVPQRQKVSVKMNRKEMTGQLQEVGNFGGRWQKRVQMPATIMEW